MTPADKGIASAEEDARLASKTEYQLGTIMTELFNKMLTKNYDPKDLELLEKVTHFYWIKKNNS